MISYKIIQNYADNFIVKLKSEGDTLLISRSLMAAEQIDTFQQINKGLALRAAYMIEEALTPELLKPDYPLDYEAMEVYTYEELSPEQLV